MILYFFSILFLASSMEIVSSEDMRNSLNCSSIFLLFFMSFSYSFSLFTLCFLKKVGCSYFY